MTRHLLLFFVLLTASLLHAEDRPLVIIVDQSFSMNQNDPKHFAVDSVQLALAILRERKEFAIIGFSQATNDLVVWGRIADHAQRAVLRGVIDKTLTFPGRATRYVAALKRTYDMLDARKAPVGTKVIFFTDGAPDDASSDIQELATRFAQREWVVDTMRLNSSKDAPGPDLARISSITRGRHIEVTNAETLIDRFVELAASENDYFTLDTTGIRDASSIPVPPGAATLVYLVAKNDDRRNRGTMASLTCDGAPVDLNGRDAYRYPEAEVASSSSANIEVALLNRPRQGLYVADFSGKPRKVYVSLAFGWNVQQLPIPSIVDEGTTIASGVQIVASDEQQAAWIGTRAEVTTTITTATGVTVLSGKANPTVTGKTITFALPWMARLPEGADRSQLHPMQVKHHVSIEHWSVTKHDAFSIRPGALPPAPPATTASWAPPAMVIATWTGQPVETSLSVTTGGPPGSWTITGNQGFSFPQALSVPGTSVLAVRFIHPTAGRLIPVITVTGTPTPPADLPLPRLEAHNYPWNGKPALTLDAPGATGIPAWSPGAADLPNQPFAGVQTDLRGEDGGTARLVIDPTGMATLATVPVQRATTFTGNAALRFGTLQPRPLQISWQFAPAKPAFEWSPTKFPTQAEKPAAWTPGSWTTGSQPVRLQSGSAGRLTATFKDLTGPNGEKLLAAYDLRGGFSPDRVNPGEEGVLQLKVYRGRDVLPGTYTGEYVATFTADNGTVETYTRPLSVTLP